MRDINAIWFNDYDAKPCLLYRSAMALRAESWVYVKRPEQAQWWVVFVSNKEEEETIIQLSKQQRTSPVIVFIKNDTKSEYHTSQAMLKLPFNYVTLFKWIDGVLEKLKDGSLFRGINSNQTCDNVQVFNQQRWYDEPFRLKQWPNIARFGTDIDIVIYCATMIQSFHTRDELLSMGMDSQQFISLLCNAERHNMITYKERQQPSKKIANSPHPHHTKNNEQVVIMESPNNNENSLDSLLRVLRLKD